MRAAPRRTCLGCRQVRPKGELIRLGRAPDGRAVLDQKGRLGGRGAYACPATACLEHALMRRRLERAFRRPTEPPGLGPGAILEHWSRR